MEEEEESAELDIVKGIYRIYLNTGGGKFDQPPPELVDVARMVLDELP